MRDQARVVAVLGPTNTGKTHYAVERMLAHRTGVIGLPLRLLAREVYDRIVAARGPSVVALVTGEERIVPERTAYWVCTVEAMPLEIGADFVAVDEIQLCADPDRGHVFTDRLLRARGLHETLFMGSDTMRAAIAAQVPGVQFMRRDRMSELTWTGAKKLSRLPPRSAIVGFSVENVYAIAELMRRQKGGCAVVMGALSPRTRNAQVALYQNGDVDFLVATDAIGMGLNLDIRHVAFSSTVKFDGRRMRALSAQEMAQIAGRAGRHLSPGSFGLTGDGRPPGEETIAAIEAHRFEPVRKLHWRNAALQFGTVERLIASLEAQSGDDWLMRMRDADDLVALRSLSAMPEIAAALNDSRAVRLLWDVCRIPDFRGISPTEHAGLLARIFGFLHDAGRVPDAWLARNIARIDRIDGDIDALSRRLAFIRTWTYVAQRRGWVADEAHWRGETRAVEDRLSDALHARLTQRFVDRRTSVLMRRLKQKESLVAEVNDKGEVTVEGEFIGRLEGFRFRQDKTATPDEARTLRQAAVKALAPHFHLRADQLYNSPDAMLDLTEQGGLMWGDTAVGKLVAGPEPLKPRAEAFVDEAAGDEVAARVQRRLQHFIDRRVAQQFEPLFGLMRDETLTGLTRGFGFRLVEAMGLLPRSAVADEVRALDQDARAALRRHGVRFGQFTVFLPALLKPAPTRLRLVLWSLAGGLDVFPESPPPGLVTIPVVAGNPAEHYRMAGYEPAGPRAIRIDMLERLADLLRGCDSRAGFEATPDMLSITGLGHEAFAELMEGLGYRATRGERPRARPATAATDTPDSARADAAAAGTAATAQGTPAPEQPDAAARPDVTPDHSAPAPDHTAPAPEAAGAAAGSAMPEGADGAALPDTPAPDSPTTDSPATDSPAPPESPTTESASPEAAPPDAALPDAAAPDSAAPDSGQPPGARPDLAAADATETAATGTHTPPPGTDAGTETGTGTAGTPAAGPREAPADTETSATPTEVFFTFTWARRSENRSRGGQRRPHAASQNAAGQNPAGQNAGSQHAGSQHAGRSRPAGEGGPGGEGAASGNGGHRGAASGKPARGRQSAPPGKPGKPKGKGDGAKHGRNDSKRTETARSYSTGPDSRGKDRIDPDNPFARALMGLRDRG